MPRVSAKKTTTKKTTVKKTAAPRATAKSPVKRAVAKTTTRKTAAKKPAVKKTAVKKATVKKTLPAAPVRVTTALRTPLTKAQLMVALSESTGIAKKDVVAVMDELASIIERHVKKRGAGQFTLPGLLKIRTVKKKATKARKGRNPFTGAEIMIAAKPARTTVRVTPLRGLKAMVE